MATVTIGGGRAVPSSFTSMLMPLAAAIRARFSGNRANAPSARQAYESMAGCRAVTKQWMIAAIPFACSQITS